MITVYHLINKHGFMIIMSRELLVTQRVRASPSGMCRADCLWFEPRVLPDTFLPSKYEFAVLFCLLVPRTCHSSLWRRP